MIAAWQWWNYLEDLVAVHKKILRLNMDETACRFYYDQLAGVLAAEPVAAAARHGMSAQNVSTKAKRSAVTHVALIADDRELQYTLPQFILGNEHVLQAHVMRELRSSGRLQQNITMLRGKSAWVTDEK